MIRYFLCVRKKAHVRFAGRLFIGWIFLINLFPTQSRCQDPDGSGYRVVDTIRPFEFPRDHGSHPDYPTEWWYFSGHLQDPAQRTFGFVLTFFRLGNRGRPGKADDAVYIAHLAVTDDRAKRFHRRERRGYVTDGTAGAEETTLEIFVGDWKAELKGETIFLSAKDETLGIDLNLRPAKPPILQGDSGLSRKGPAPGEASYYYSYSRLEGDGGIRINNKYYRITKAVAWMDHEMLSFFVWGLRWDWFAIQFDNQEEIMVYQLRTGSGSISPFSFGTVISPEGRSMPLRADDFSIEALGHWPSPVTKITYPIKWRIIIPSLALNVTVKPTVTWQEFTRETADESAYWEGRCRVAGKRGGRRVSGNAFVELVGYK